MIYHVFIELHRCQTVFRCWSSVDNSDWTAPDSGNTTPSAPPNPENIPPARMPETLPYWTADCFARNDGRKDVREAAYIKKNLFGSGREDTF